MFIDTHAHLNFREFAQNLDEIINDALDARVKKIINVGSNYKTSKNAIDIVNKQEISSKLFAAVGCHPIHLAADITEKTLFEGKEYSFVTKKEEFVAEKYQQLIDQNKESVVAIGETGLDYYHFQSEKDLNVKEEFEKQQEIQKKVFQEHISLAQLNNLPLILHCRGSKETSYKAYDDMIAIIEKSNSKNEQAQYGNLQGVIHCFAGNLKQAKKFVDLGFYIGVNGIITFKNAKEIQNIIKEIPLKKIILETDCPYLAPEPFRGKRNEPKYIPVIAEYIAKLKNISVEMIAKNTTKNAEKLFNI